MCKLMVSYQSITVTYGHTGVKCLSFSDQVTLIRYRFRFNAAVFFMALNDKIRSEKLCV